MYFTQLFFFILNVDFQQFFTEHGNHNNDINAVKSDSYGYKGKWPQGGAKHFNFFFKVGLFTKWLHICYT